MTILAAYVPTAEGRSVLDRAVAEALLRDDNLIVARHVRAEAPSTMVPAVDEEQRRSHQPVDKLRDDLDAVEQELRARNVRVETVMLTEGKDAADELLQLADERDVDLIVIGVRRRSPVGKAFLGSDAQDILLKANCPVVAVKAD